MFSSLNLSDYRNLKCSCSLPRKNTPSTQKPITNVRRAIILAWYHLHYPEKTSAIPVYLLSLNAGYVKTYTAASASVLHFCFQFPAPKLPSAVLHLKMPFSLRFSLRLCISLCQRRSAYSSYSTPLPCSYYNEIFFLSRQRPYFKTKNQNKKNISTGYFSNGDIFYLSFFYCFVLLLNACDQCFHCIFQNFISECFR